MHNLDRGKSPKMWATSVILKKTFQARINNRPMDANSPNLVTRTARSSARVASVKPGGFLIEHLGTVSSLTLFPD
jgi:hypothetical protein